MIAKVKIYHFLCSFSTQKKKIVLDYNICAFTVRSFSILIRKYDRAPKYPFLGSLTYFIN